MIEPYKTRLANNAEDFDQIIIDMCKEIESLQRQLKDKDNALYEDLEHYTNKAIQLEKQLKEANERVGELESLLSSANRCFGWHEPFIEIKERIKETLKEKDNG